MSKPTQEQIKELWEGCVKGNELSNLLIGGINSIDLNNLFKHAPHRMSTALWRKIIRNWASTITGDYEKDTLDLFWAIYGVMK